MPQSNEMILVIDEHWRGQDEYGIKPGLRDGVTTASRPSKDTFGPGLDEQYTTELYYRFQVLKTLAITPDVQLLINPALNPNEDVIAIFGLRARISF